MCTDVRPLTPLVYLGCDSLLNQSAMKNLDLLQSLLQAVFMQPLGRPASDASSSASTPSFMTSLRKKCVPLFEAAVDRFLRVPGTAAAPLPPSLSSSVSVSLFHVASIVGSLRGKRPIFDKFLTPALSAAVDR